VQLSRHFVVVARRQIAQPQRFALARTVDRERSKSAKRELDAREKHAHFLAIVETVEKTTVGARRGRSR
jgi:hypothetical protein